MSLSLQDLADRCKMSKAQIWRYENAESDPTADALMRLAKELEVSADYLLGISDDANPNIRPEDLSTVERDLVRAYRNGDFQELMRIGANRSEITSIDKKPIPKVKD